MAYFKIKPNKKGELQAKIQVSGKDLETGESKLFTKRIYNTDNLTEAKFRKFVEREADAFEDDVQKAYEEGTTVLRTKVLTFAELMTEWKQTILDNLSRSYYLRAEDVEAKFNKFLKRQNLANKPVSAITVRDVQLFLNSFGQKQYSIGDTVKLKKDFPKEVNFRLLARENIVNRCTSHNFKHNNSHIISPTARKICDFYNLDYDEYFEPAGMTRNYSKETIKGFRRVLRTVFNEAVRYDWIDKNPVCGTKVEAGKTNITLRPVLEKEVFSFKETREFIAALDQLDDSHINYKVMSKIMLLTGVRCAELHGLRWEDIDFNNKLLHVRRNRIYQKKFGTYEKPPKTATSIRDIPMPDALIEELKKYYEWFKIACPDIDDNLDKYYLAVNLTREPEYPQSVGNWLKRFEEKHGFKSITCHGLRHTYCSLLLAQNVPIQTVSKYMGHSDSTVTLKVYAHFIPDTQEKVMAVLNNL